MTISKVLVSFLVISVMGLSSAQADWDADACQVNVSTDFNTTSTGYLCAESYRESFSAREDRVHVKALKKMALAILQIVYPGSELLRDERVNSLHEEVDHNNGYARSPAPYGLSDLKVRFRASGSSGLSFKKARLQFSYGF